MNFTKILILLSLCSGVNYSNSMIKPSKQDLPDIPAHRPRQIVQKIELIKSYCNRTQTLYDAMRGEDGQAAEQICFDDVIDTIIFDPKEKKATFNFKNISELTKDPITLSYDTLLGLINKK